MTDLSGNAFLAAKGLAQSIESSTNRIEESRGRVREAKDALLVTQEVDDLRREIDRLRLHLACVISLLIRSGAVTKETYKQVLDAIDQGDGVADGMFGGTIEADGTLSAGADQGDLHRRELAQTIREMGADAP
jgi:hypothetical protein